jgi:mannose-6-phosphate isomerase-like protein (cupin superfamily)
MEHPDKTHVIVTRIDDDGKSTLSEEFVDAVLDYDGAGQAVYMSSHLWGTADGIPTIAAGVNPGKITDPWFPGPGGIRFRFFTFLPSSDDNTGEGAVAPLQDVATDTSNFAEAFDPERPGMHISDSIDFVHVLSGEMVLEMEHNEILVKAGDVIIMRAGWHNWRNESDQPCTVASLMVGAHRQ